MTSIVERLGEILSVEMAVLITAALPIIELRGAIPFGVLWGLSPFHATLISFLGSMIPVPIILFTIRPIFNWMKQFKYLKGIVERLTLSSEKKNAGKIQKFGAWALIPIVAIPLPGTGVWSGSLAAALLNIRFKWAFPAILLGNFIAAMAVVALTNGAAQIIGR